MSVLIKDMKMPISCIECPCNLKLFFCKVYSGMPITDASSLTINDTTINVKRPDWCPIVELPEHHGRLIDADRLMRIYEDRLEKVADRYGVDSSEAGILSGAMKLLMIELGIVEAE